MPDSVDYAFLSALEGGCKTVAYVPAEKDSNSGVTIATGFDLGARNESDLTSLGLSAPLVAQLKPYLGKKKKDATDALKKAPLTITLSDAKTIDKIVKKTHLTSLKLSYDAAVIGDKTKKRFEDLPAEAQTVIASVSFQYGSLSLKAPQFWKAAVSQDWVAVSKVLKNFQDKHRTRRLKEAVLIDKLIP